MKDASSAYGKYVAGFLELVTVVQADDSITHQKGNKLMSPFKSQIYVFESNVKKRAEAGTETIRHSTPAVIAMGKTLRKAILVFLVVGVCLSALLGVLIERLSENLRQVVEQFKL